MKGRSALRTRAVHGAPRLWPLGRATLPQAATGADAPSAVRLGCLVCERGHTRLWATAVTMWSSLGGIIIRTNGAPLTRRARAAAQAAAPVVARSGDNATSWSLAAATAPVPGVSAPELLSNLSLGRAVVNIYTANFPQPLQPMGCCNNAQARAPGATAPRAAACDPHAVRCCRECRAGPQRRVCFHWCAGRSACSGVDAIV